MTTLIIPKMNSSKINSFLQRGSAENRNGGHILANGLPTTFCFGSTPNTRESTDTALQSPNTYTSSSPSSDIDFPLPSFNNRSINRSGSSSHKPRSGPIAFFPPIQTSWLSPSITMSLSPGSATMRFTKSELDETALGPVMSSKLWGGRKSTTSPRLDRWNVCGSFSTRRTSPRSSVGSMLALGMA